MQGLPLSLSHTPYIAELPSSNNGEDVVTHMHVSECSVPSAEYRKLDERLKLTTKRVIRQEKVIRSMTKECQRKILAVRHFWKEIYNEGTRGGKIKSILITNNYTALAANDIT